MASRDLHVCMNMASRDLHVCMNMDCSLLLDVLIFFSMVGSIPSRLATPCFNMDTCFRTNWTETNTHREREAEV